MNLRFNFLTAQGTRWPSSSLNSPLSTIPNSPSPRILPSVTRSRAISRHENEADAATALAPFDASPGIAA